jgi:hypothetical protein
MDQVAVRNHGMMCRFFKFSGRVVLGGAALMLRRMLQEFGGFQVMIDALLRHVFRVTNGIVNLGKLWALSASRTTANFLILARADVSSQVQPLVLSKQDCDSGSRVFLSRRQPRRKVPLGNGRHMPLMTERPRK